MAHLLMKFMNRKFWGGRGGDFKRSWRNCRRGRTWGSSYEDDALFFALFSLSGERN